MSLMKGFDIASSGMAAQRLRLHLVGSNLANASTTKTEEGGPYQRQDAVFTLDPASDSDPSIAGVKVSEIKKDPSLGPLVHDPSHPDADADGNVRMPNVNVVEEMVDMMTAARSFEANVQAFQTLREMVQQSMGIGR